MVNAAQLSAAFEALTQQPVRYIPPWERQDRGEPVERSGELHVIARIGDRYFESADRPA